VLGAEAPNTPACSKTQEMGTQGRPTMRNVALDLGRRISYCEVRNQQAIGRRTVTAMEQLADLLSADRPARVAIEASREAWAIAKWLKQRGHHVQLVDTTRVRALGIGHHNRKNDRIDAEVLARAVERDLIPEAHLLSEEQQAIRLQLGVRRALVETRTQLVVRIRHLLKARGVRLPKCDADAFVVRIEKVALADEHKALIAPLLVVLKALQPEVAKADEKLNALVEHDAVLRRLQTAPGVGPVIAAMFVSVIDNPKRFKKAHQVESYLGLVPSEFTSGKRQLGAITKRGNAYLRSLLVQGAWNILRRKDAHREPLVTWAHQVKERRGKKIAVLAVARKLAGMLWAMWVDGTDYDPVRAGVASSDGTRLNADRQTAAANALSAAAERARDHREASAPS
jgi:transposase